MTLGCSGLALFHDGLMFYMILRRRACFLLDASSGGPELELLSPSPGPWL
jgi:hypothetical protein